MEKVVSLLTKKGMTIATMESATGGAIASAITDVAGASEVLKYSAVTYSNEYKIKMGVKKETIDLYSVYSVEVAKEMSKEISEFANSSLGVGVTGKMNRGDRRNKQGNDDEIFVSIYERKTDTYHTFTIKADTCKSRHENKEKVIAKLVEELEICLKK